MSERQKDVAMFAFLYVGLIISTFVAFKYSDTMFIAVATFMVLICEWHDLLGRIKEIKGEG